MYARMHMLYSSNEPVCGGPISGAPDGCKVDYRGSYSAYFSLLCHSESWFIAKQNAHELL